MRKRSLSVFKFADGLVFYGNIKKSLSDGWLIDIKKVLDEEGESLPFEFAGSTHIERGAVEVCFTVLRGGKYNGRHGSSSPT